MDRRRNLQRMRTTPLYLILFFLVILIGVNQLAIAKKRAKINNRKNIKITYANSAWNSDSSKVDEAVLILRDANSKKTVSIPLQETEPDSSVFVGKYSLDWGDDKKIIPELYIPNQQKMKTREGRKETLNHIKNKKIPRKPFLLTKSKTGSQSLDIFDTKSQARKAFKAYKEGKKVREEIAKRKLLPSDQQSQMDFVKEKEEELELQRQKQAEIDREKERIRLEQLEKQKALERAKKQKLLAEAEKKKRRQLALKLAREGLALYAKGKFQEASQKFAQSVELDPENQSFYYSYAITLYRTENFNKSLVMFNLTKEQPGINEIERQYYVGLNHFRLKEWEPALKSFKQVKTAKVKDLSPSAAFYEGLVLMQLKRWNPAKEAFQYVLDNSTNPQMDQQAETYIEKIIQLQYFAEKKSKKHIVSADIAAIHDSNILLLSDSASGTSGTDKDGQRIELRSSYEYRALYGKVHELSAKLSLDYFYSLDSAFEAADPTTLSLSIPYAYKTKAWKKSYKLELVTGYDILQLNSDGEGARETILNTAKLDWKNTFVMTPTWFSTYALKLANASSQLSSSTGDDDSSGLSTGLGYSNILLIDKKAGKTFVQDFTYTINNANGKNEYYNKLALTLIYLMPLNWKDFILSNTLAYSSTDYSKGTEGRKDTNLSLKFDFNKSLTKIFSTTTSLNYTQNSSNIDSRSYDKYSITFWLKSKYDF